MPATFGALLLAREVDETLRVNFLGLLRADDADLVVSSTETPSRVDHWMNMQFRSGWFAREFAKTLSELFLEIVVEIILRAEEYNAALGN
jgi:hypothetical protein